MSSAFYIPTINFMGTGCLKDAADSIQSQGFKKGLIVTDKILNQIGVVKQVQDLLGERGDPRIFSLLGASAIEAPLRWSEPLLRIVLLRLGRVHERLAAVDA